MEKNMKATDIYTKNREEMKIGRVIVNQRGFPGWSRRHRMCHGNYRE